MCQPCTAQGNKLSSLDDAQKLAKLPCLRTLRLSANPMCEHPAYWTAIRRQLPNLRSLDGAFGALASATDDEDGALLSIPEPTPWLEGFSWGDDPSGGPRLLIPRPGALWGSTHDFGVHEHRDSNVGQVCVAVYDWERRELCFTQVCTSYFLLPTSYLLLPTDAAAASSASHRPTVPPDAAPTAAA